MTTLTGTGLAKTFRYRHVLSGVAVHANSGDVVGIVGPNGSGKSTLARILAGVLRPDQGSVALTIDGRDIPTQDRPFHVGLVAPYLAIYDEFTPVELLALQRQLHGESVDHERILQTLEDVGLADRRNDAVRTLSSGLRQRAVLALAVHREPALLIFDEPTITLDAAGVSIVHAQIQRQQSRGGITILATNDDRERSWCTDAVAVGC